MSRRVGPGIRHVVCIGLMAAGKSTVGGQVAGEQLPATLAALTVVVADRVSSRRRVR